MVFEKMKQILADQLDADIDSITLETDIQDDLGADSLMLLKCLCLSKMSLTLKFPMSRLKTLRQ